VASTILKPSVISSTRQGGGKRPGGHCSPKNRLDPAQTNTRMIAVTTSSRVTSEVLLLNLCLVGMADLHKEQEHDEAAKRQRYDHNAHYLNGVRTEYGIWHGTQLLKLRLQASGMATLPVRP
jgi:hypothetical protein